MAETTAPAPPQGAAQPASQGFWQSDIGHDFKTSPVAIVAAVVAVVMIAGAMIGPFFAPQNPFDPATLDLMDGFTKPMQRGASSDKLYWLGTDSQGRDIFSALLYGSRVSILVGFASVIFSMVVGIGLGLIAGYVGGRTESVIMRVADIQLSFPAILVALLVFGVARGIIPPAMQEQATFFVMILALGLSNWAQYARTVRGSTLVEKNKDYVSAARIIGIAPFSIMGRHVFPNVAGPVLVIATINLALAIIEESTLSFLGVGMSPTQPSLGTLIRFGQQFLFSGEWWILFFPALTLILLALSINLLGDWLRDALNPRLR